ncbi:MAG: hypothetical protein AMJ53_01280 [Gammaproteobacteria bacterium SG8_11]|nr:MAG: hypothetical protein AMJ53_01280 [Gammaproteobacteria bacterium SG8_11]
MTPEERDVRLCLTNYEYALCDYQAVSPRRFRPYIYFIWVFSATLATLSVSWAIALAVTGLVLFALTCMKTQQEQEAWSLVQERKEALNALAARSETYKKILNHSFKELPMDLKKHVRCFRPRAI